MEIFWKLRISLNNSNMIMHIKTIFNLSTFSAAGINKFQNCRDMVTLGQGKWYYPFKNRFSQVNKHEKNNKIWCGYLPVKIAVELWLGSRGQMPVPENSCFNRKIPSSINCGCIVVEVDFVTGTVSFRFWTVEFLFLSETWGVSRIVV